jgi:hypothetical protein
MRASLIIEPKVLGDARGLVSVLRGRVVGLAMDLRRG